MSTDKNAYTLLHYPFNHIHPHGMASFDIIVRNALMIWMVVIIVDWIDETIERQKGGEKK